MHTKRGKYNMIKITQFIITVICLSLLHQAAASDNLQTCLSGKYPSLCNYSQLSSPQAKQAREAERRENLKTYLTGKYPSLCKHELLRSDELNRVSAAELAKNRKICLDGRYQSLCDHHELSPKHQKEAMAAEAQASKNKKKAMPVAVSNTISSCEDGYWIKSVTQGGEIVILEDGSVWEISSIDRIYNSLASSHQHSGLSVPTYQY